MKIFNSLIVAALFITTISIGACREMTATSAERCVLIDLQQKRGRELLPLLEELARKNGFESDTSSPGSVRIYRGSSINSRAEIIYTIGIGEFGAALTLFRFDQKEDSDIYEIFDNFISEKIKKRYKFKSCQDIDGFKIPVVYR